MTVPNIKRRIFLTIPERMFEILEKEREKYVYDSVQELILEAIRDKFVRYQKSEGSSKRGRPKKLNIKKGLQLKEPFSKKDGEPIEL